MRPFRFAVQGVNATSASEWRSQALQVEQLGYSCLFVADHYLGPGPAGANTLYPPQQLAPIAAMAAAAAWTSTLRIGCRVFCGDYHVPAVLAKEAATLDVLSGGRLELGIGAGWHADEYRAMGLGFAEAAERVSKLEEMVVLLKAHFSGEQLTVEGRHVHVAGYSGLPVPVQKPHPPIMIGGSKPRVLSLAAREADIVSIANVPWQDPDPDAELQRRVGFVRHKAGDRLSQMELELSPSYAEITAEVEETLKGIAPGLRNADPDALRRHPNVLVGSIDEIVDRLHFLRESAGISYVTLPLEQAEAFAPVVSRLAGT